MNKLESFQGYKLPNQNLHKAKDFKMKPVRTMTILTRSLQASAVGVTVLAANPSDAAIIGSKIQGGFINQPQTPLELKIVVPPPEGIIIRNTFETRDENGNIFVRPNPDPNRDVLGIIEKQSVLLPRDISVLDGFNEQKDRPNSIITKGTLVSSYLFYFNPPGGDEPRFDWSGQITFDATVLGLVGGFRVHWPHTTNVVGLDNTEYVFASAIDPRDEVISFENNVLTFDVSSKSGLEPFRVITSGNPVIPSVPEPLTLLGTGTALGFIPLFKRAYSKKNKAKGKD
ncbi:PEP-CTERM sorting domain-containing protein [Coleofasciculus sp. E2-BRE-01]|uniref:PEP-CTERM sorting domain-containing protein n=1 Tax=Coleofasciculus sp. E2-BRE-01 TaxID=3069524 RepID=UPI0032F427F9